MDDQIKAEYSALNYVPGALIEIDLTSQLITYMSSIAFSIFGYSQADIEAGMHGKDIFANDAEIHRAMTILESLGRKSFEEHSPYRPVEKQELYDFMLKKKSGEPFYGECQGAFVLDNNLVPTGFRLYIRDLTEQRTMEASLAESEKKYRLLIDNSIDCIWMLDKEMRFTFISPTLEDILGFKPEQWIGTRLSSHFREKEFIKVGSIALDALKNYKTFSPATLETIMLNSKNEEVEVEIGGNVLMDNDGNLLGLQGVTRDISARKLVEVALFESHDKYRNIFDNSKDAVYITTESGSLIEFNEALVKMLGYSPEELKTLTLGELYRNQDDRLRFQDEINEKGYVKEFELQIPKKDGTIIDCMDTSSLYVRASGAVEYHGIIRDITEKKQAELRIKKALIEAEKANKVKDMFLANITHEVRTPLTSIIGYTDYLRKSLADKLTPKEQKSFDFIHQNSDRLLNMVNSILNFSNTQSGRFLPNPKIVYLNSLCKKLCNELRPRADKKGLNLTFTSTTEDDKIWLDEYSFSHSLENIISNGIKYTRAGKIEVSVKRLKKNLIIQVSDTGIGMSEEFIEKAFQPFNQESEGLTKDYQGIGLGLALTKRYLEWNNVEISVISKKGQGSIFTLNLPE